MTWDLFVGDGKPRRAHPDQEAWHRIPQPPPWRRQDDPIEPPAFELPDGLAVAVNAALHLRRPLLLTGVPGSGKSTFAKLLAHELELGPLLHWHITSKSVLNDALYQYDALGRLHAVQTTSDRQAVVSERADKVSQNPATLGDALTTASGPIGSEQNRNTPEGGAAATNEADDVARYVTLGSLGTALASRRVRVILIDEIDKSDLDLPGDLLNVMENGQFTIPALERATGGPFQVRGADHDTYFIPADGTVNLRLEHFPVIIFTSNRERTFPAPFLRRCVRFEMPAVTESALKRILTRHLKDGDPVTTEQKTIAEFARRIEEGNQLAVNQLLEFVYLMSGADSKVRDKLKQTMLQDLGDT